MITMVETIEQYGRFEIQKSRRFTSVVFRAVHGGKVCHTRRVPLDSEYGKENMEFAIRRLKADIDRYGVPQHH